MMKKSECTPSAPRRGFWQCLMRPFLLLSMATAASAQQQAGTANAYRRHFLEVTTPGAALAAFVTVTNPGNSAPAYGPVVVRGDVADLAPLLANAIDAQATAPLDGLLATLDASSRVESALAFTGGAVVELALARLDATHPAPAELTVAISPGSVRSESGEGADGEIVQREAVHRREPTMFRLSMPGLSSAVDHILSVDGVRMTRAYTSAAGGEPGTMVRRQGGWACGRVMLTLPSSAALPFVLWFRQSVAAGPGDPAREKTLDLELRRGTSGIVTLRALGVGIVRIDSDPAALGDRVRVELAPTEWRVVTTAVAPDRR